MMMWGGGRESKGSANKKKGVDQIKIDNNWIQTINKSYQILHFLADSSANICQVLGKFSQEVKMIETNWFHVQISGQYGMYKTGIRCA